VQTPAKLRLVVMTVDRSPQYVHHTLASLFASDRLVHEVAGVSLLVGSSDARYLDGYRHHRRLSIHPVDERESSRIQNWTTGRKFCHNYHRCLSVPLEGARGLCVCEDDVVFRDGFITKLLAAVQEMETEHELSRYLLACYVPYRLADDPALRRGRLFASYHAPTFFGTQCMYYPSTVLGDLAERMLHDGVQRHLQPGDWIVRDFGAEINGIYGTVRSLAQHVGRSTTGLGKFHSAPTFDEPFPDAADEPAAVPPEARRPELPATRTSDGRAPRAWGG
jgi:hypothetical protein